ncbi:dynamin-binding protein-like [Oppia nitens]|uniref:dynamin-binding protein-like n=1 Tax=Oppia nitens TaxID=1686743 RepID=UPI0023DCA500|nr:dynamin-binding protein-like [Oppia nitens]
MNTNNSDHNQPFIAQVIRHFDTEFADELAARVGDIIEVETKVDKYWLYGHTNSHSGRIPTANCRQLTIDLNSLYPNGSEDQRSLFAANNDFIHECVDGDLRFTRGDLIIGLEPVDENWWNGYVMANPNLIGIFPLTHVWQLDNKYLPKKIKPSDENYNNDRKMYAKVVIEMHSQLDNEIDLYKDEIMVITDTYDKMYYSGHSLNGQREGIFPKNFVKILDNYQPTNDENNMCGDELVTNNTDTQMFETEVIDSSANEENPPSYENVINSMVYCEDQLMSSQPQFHGYSNGYVGDVQSYGRTLFPFRAEFPNELSLKVNEIVHLIRHIDNEWIEGEIDGKVGIFPKSYIEIIVDCDTNSISNQNNSIIESFPSDTFARVLYDFNGEFEGDLKVSEGDTLTLLRKMDTNWYEVMDDLENIGLVPYNYCEIIEDIPSYQSLNSLAHKVDENKLAINTTNDLINENHLQVNSIPVIKDIEPVITPMINQEFEPTIVNNDNQQNVDNSDNKMLNLSIKEPIVLPKMSPKEPRRSAPPVPKLNENQVSPQRPPPPVPRHKIPLKLHASNDSIDRIHMNRNDSIRASIASNSSSGSTHSDSAFGVTKTQMTAEDQQRVDERKKKVREQRSCVIMELLQTERDYRQSLEVCADIFLTNPEEARNCGIDLQKLFGNLRDIIEVSSLLIQRLEESTQMKKYEHQMVGKCFLDVLDQMKTTYSQYCRNHDQMLPLYRRYESIPDARQYLMHGFDIMKERTNCFDIPSVLIKPVQRILKYPLLLNELHKCTEDGHQDKPDLILAIDRITDMATHINEFKRRQDLVHKYRCESNNKLSHKLLKFNFHTVMKKSSRLGHRITSTLGLSSTTKDDEFNHAVHKFRTLEKTIKIFIKDKQAFMKSVEDFCHQGLAVVEAIGEYYDKRNRQQEVEQLRTTHRMIVTQYLTLFNDTVDRDVTPVLDKLLQKFSGPNKLINKRYDKMTDFDSLSKKLECNKDMSRLKTIQDQQLMAKNVYEAINTQLLEELPKLCELLMQMFQDCIQSFLLARKQLIGRIAKHHLILLELPSVMSFKSGSTDDINDTFQIKHNLITEQLLDEISILAANVFPNVASGGMNQSDTKRHSKRSSQMTNINLSVANTVGVNHNMNKNVQQSASQRAYLQSRYISHQLYEAIKPYEATDVLDIYLNKGDLVGVIKQQHPMGNHHKWFVDTGNAKGFVLSDVLAIHSNPWVSTLNNTNVRSQTTYEKPEKSEKLMTQTSMHSSNNTTSPLIQHQYKVFPSPDPSVQLRHETETHRYVEVDDSPPRYSRLDMSNTSASLMTFETSLDEKQQLKSQEILNLGEFDPYAPVGRAESSSIPSIPCATIEHRYDVVSDDCNNKMNTKSSAPLPPQQQPNDMYFAAYPFRANGDNQLSLEFGQSVILLKDRDLNGNNQWWFVADKEGNTGYVPSNYLQKYQTK